MSQELVVVQDLPDFVGLTSLVFRYELDPVSIATFIRDVEESGSVEQQCRKIVALAIAAQRPDEPEPRPVRDGELEALSFEAVAAIAELFRQALDATTGAMDRTARERKDKPWLS